MVYQYFRKASEKTTTRMGKLKTIEMKKRIHDEVIAEDTNHWRKDNGQQKHQKAGSRSLGSCGSITTGIQADFAAVLYASIRFAISEICI